MEEEKFLDQLRAFLHQANAAELLTASGLVREQLELRCMDASDHVALANVATVSVPHKLNHIVFQGVNLEALEDEGVGETFGFMLDQELNFGKFRGKTIKDVLCLEPEYLAWCADNVGFFRDEYLEGKSEELKALIENHIQLNPHLKRHRR